MFDDEPMAEDTQEDLGALYHVLLCEMTEVLERGNFENCTIELFEPWDGYEIRELVELEANRLLDVADVSDEYVAVLVDNGIKIINVNNLDSFYLGDDDYF